MSVMYSTVTFSYSFLISVGQRNDANLQLVSIFFYKYPVLIWISRCGSIHPYGHSVRTLCWFVHQQIPGGYQGATSGTDVCKNCIYSIVAWQHTQQYCCVYRLTKINLAIVINVNNFSVSIRRKPTSVHLFLNVIFTSQWSINNGQTLAQTPDTRFTRES